MQQQQHQQRKGRPRVAIGILCTVAVAALINILDFDGNYYGDASSNMDAHQSLRRNLQAAEESSLTISNDNNDPHIITLSSGSNVTTSTVQGYEYEQEFPYPLTCSKNELQTFLESNNLINKATGEKKIKITLVYHIGMVGNWHTVVADQFNILNECGTLDIADQLILTYSNSDIKTVLDFIHPLLGPSNRNKIKTMKESTKVPWEAPAMNQIYDHCTGSDNPKKEVVFYFHNKGTSRWREDWRSTMEEEYSYSYSLYWRKYLEYFTIERPQLCLEKLLVDNYSSCGPNWREGNGDKYAPPYEGPHHQITNHYSGNFWSATCDHINHLKPLTSKRYTDGELWIGTYEGKQAKLTSHFKKLYSNHVVPEEYALVQQEELEEELEEEEEETVVSSQEETERRRIKSRHKKWQVQVHRRG